MSTYTPEKMLVSTGLDEIALRLGLRRLPGETLGEFRRRVYLEARDPSGPSQADYIRTTGRKVGELDTLMFQISPVTGGGAPADPFIEITSTHFRAYDDYANDSIDIELNFASRSGSDAGYFLRDIKTAVDASTYFDLTVMDSSYTYKRSNHLRYSNTNGFIASEGLNPSRENRLEFDQVSEIWFTNPLAFQTLKGSVASLAESGDYYVDEANGIVFSYDTASGFASYSYRDFPFKVFWQPVRAWPLNDNDSSYLRYGTQISDTTGEVEYTVLNSVGAEIANEVLAIHPLGWGR